MPIDISKCELGDLLLFYRINAVAVLQAAARSLKVLTVLPALVSAAQGGSTGIVGSATCCHAAIVSRKRDGQAVRRYITHATGGGNAYFNDVTTDQFDGDGDASIKVFRMQTSQAVNVPADAAAVALTWAGDQGERNYMTYSMGKAGMSAFRSSSYGSGAKSRAAVYRAHKDTKGGPPNMANTGNKSFFCSMFVIACYQAVMNDRQAETYFALDAKNTTPMYLDGYLTGSSFWKEVNVLKSE